jgi:hypothetical protein
VVLYNRRFCIPGRIGGDSDLDRLDACDGAGLGGGSDRLDSCDGLEGGTDELDSCGGLEGGSGELDSCGGLGGESGKSGSYRRIHNVRLHAGSEHLR